MPSVRVKRSFLADCCQNEPRGIANLFTPSAPTARLDPEKEPSSNVVTTIAITAPDVSSATPSGDVPRPFQRPRSSSRVTEHCMNQTSKLVKTRSRNTRNSQPDLQVASSSRLSPTRIENIATEDHHLDIYRHDSGRIGSALSFHSGTDESNHHHDDIVEHLDAIDPQVATVSSLTNAANALLIPPLSFYSRKPVVVLPDLEQENDAEKGQQFEDSLDRHVDDVLKRPSKFKRTMQGVWSFLKTPLGIVTGIYGFLVVFWGAAIVIFLAKIINLHNANTQGFWVEICSQIENGLFTVTGIGLIPTRILDTYRICKIWRYKRRTAKLRTKAGLPQLYDVDDLPDPDYDLNYVHVLTDGEQLDLHKQQEKFRHSQTWYRPHGTETHRAFPITAALLICCLNDGNSIFQIILCSTMWGLNRFQRPAWSTGILIPCSFLCGIASAIFIWRGGQRTKRTKEVQERLRRVLAMTEPYRDGKAATIINVPAKHMATLQPNSAVSGNPPQRNTEDVATDEHMTTPLIK